MDGESEGLKRQLSRLEQTIQAEKEKGKVLQVHLWQLWLHMLYMRSLTVGHDAEMWSILTSLA